MLRRTLRPEGRGAVGAIELEALGCFEVGRGQDRWSRPSSFHPSGSRSIRAEHWPTSGLPWMRIVAPSLGSGSGMAIEGSFRTIERLLGRRLRAGMQRGFVARNGSLHRGGQHGQEKQQRHGTTTSCTHPSTHIAGPPHESTETAGRTVSPSRVGPGSAGCGCPRRRALLRRAPGSTGSESRPRIRAESRSADRSASHEPRT